MTNKEFAEQFKKLFKRCNDRDRVVKAIEENYCHNIIFADNYDKNEYIIGWCKMWDIFD